MTSDPEIDEASGPPDTALSVVGASPDYEGAARKLVLDQLTGQARSRKELSDRLAKKGIPADVFEPLLDRFEEVGLIDDAAFARMWVASRQSGKGLARRALSQELRRKGIADDVAREAVAEVEPEDEREAAVRLVRRKLRSMNALADEVKVRRLVGMLARKGYSPGLAMGVVRAEVTSASSIAFGDEMPESLA